MAAAGFMAEVMVGTTLTPLACRPAMMRVLPAPLYPVIEEQFPATYQKGEAVLKRLAFRVTAL